MYLNPLYLALPALLSAATPAQAQEATTPYWASIRASEVNMRAGPGEDYRISWIYHRQHLPLKVLRLKEGWRLVQDPDGAQGWIMARFLTRERTAYVVGTRPTELREQGTADARVLWRVAPGVVGKLGDCGDGWCAFAVDDTRKGYVAQTRLWGAGEP